MDIIDIKGLTKRYGRRVGIESLDLHVPAGTLFGFLGPNGSGKSTTIRVLMGLLRPTAGSARVFDLDAWRCSHQIKAEVGYLPGDLRLYPFWTCDSALRLISKVRRRDVCEAGRELAEEFELDTDVPVGSMSRGMRQKLGLILALAHRPKLLILDEPTSGLDPIMQKRLLRRLR
ncbi:MAG: ABC transporter ATP-binding protein, partial [Planctomycetes bacterium]|nr:ABC transporter ATP-binding protein [Planctomycetota bacterium]